MLKTFILNVVGVKWCVDAFVSLHGIMVYSFVFRNKGLACTMLEKGHFPSWITSWLLFSCPFYWLGISYWYSIILLLNSVMLYTWICLRRWKMTYKKHMHADYAWLAYLIWWYFFFPIKSHQITGFTTLTVQETEAECDTAGDGVKQ